MDLVVERVEPSRGSLLGRAVELALKPPCRVDPTPLHVISLGHSWTLLFPQASMKQGPFASGGVVLSRTLERYYGPLRHLPGHGSFPGAHRL